MHACACTVPPCPWCMIIDNKYNNRFIHNSRFLIHLIWMSLHGSFLITRVCICPQTTSTDAVTPDYEWIMILVSFVCYISDMQFGFFQVIFCAIRFFKIISLVLPSILHVVWYSFYSDWHDQLNYWAYIWCGHDLVYYNNNY